MLLRRKRAFVVGRLVSAGKNLNSFCFAWRELYGKNGGMTSPNGDRTGERIKSQKNSTTISKGVTQGDKQFETATMLWTSDVQRLNRALWIIKLQLEQGGDGLTEFDLMKMLLCFAIPRKNTEQVARHLIKKIGSFRGAIISASIKLSALPGMDEQAVAALKVVQASGIPSFFGLDIARFERVSYAMEIRAGFVGPVEKVRLWFGGRLKEIRTFIGGLFEDDLHAKRVDSLANATLGVMTEGSQAVAVIGQSLAQVHGLITKHAIKQVGCLLSNKGIDVWDSFLY